jgi:hypothetical protein
VAGERKIYPKSNDLLKLVAPTVLWCAGSKVYGKSVVDAISEMGGVSTADPNGVKWMLICIGLLFVVAITLISVTVAYYLKSQKKQ